MPSLYRHNYIGIADGMPKCMCADMLGNFAPPTRDYQNGAAKAYRAVCMACLYSYGLC